MKGSLTVSAAGRTILTFAFVVFSGTSAISQQFNSTIRDELVAMEKADQDARTRCTDGPADNQIKCFAEILETVDRPHAKRLTEIFDRIGFPNTAKVGKEGLEAFMIVLQHSPTDELRIRSRKPIAAAFMNKEISPSEYSNFIDRLRLHLGKKQIYGSNFDLKNGKMVMSPTKDLKNLAKRRAKIGLPTIEEYAKMMKEVYHLDVEVPKH